MERLTKVLEPAFTLFTRSEATVALQPILATKHVPGVGVFLEALLRLPQSSDPACHVHVLTLAEQLGFAHHIDLFVLSKVVELLQRHPSVTIAINVSQRSILEDGQKIIRRLAASQVCKRIVVEITESSQIPHSWIAAFAAGIREIGCLLAVDDFDTGSANDELVQTVRPHILKFGLDDTSKANQDRLARTVEVAKSVGAKLVVEKVDTVEKHTLALAHRVDFVQGFLLSRPFLAQTLPSWLDSSSKHVDVPSDYTSTTFIPNFAATQRVQAANRGRHISLKQKTGS